MPTPNYATTLANVRTALTEIERLIQPGDAKPYAFYVQGMFPYWTNNIAQSSIQKQSTGLWGLTFNVSALLHMGWITEGMPGELELEAQELGIKGALEFAQRNRLQCTTHPDGVPGVGTVNVVRSGPGNAQTGADGKSTRAVIIELQIPVTFRMETKG